MIRNLDSEPRSRALYRFSADQFHRMTKLGILPSGADFLDGMITLRLPTDNGYPHPWHFDTATYHLLISQGVFHEDEPIELIRGEVVFQMPQGINHGVVVEKMNKQLLRLLPDELALRCQLPIRLPDSEPEPDFVICLSPEVRGHHHPDHTQIFLIIEVADSSLIDDQTTKLELYANAGIPCYWVVNLEDRQIEVYTQPKHAPAHEASFENQQIYSSGQLIPLVVRGETLGLIPVDSLLPAIAQ